MKRNIIYALTEKESTNYRYIGKSQKGKKRLYDHLKPFSLKLKTHKNNWIKSVLNSGSKIEMIIIEDNIELELLSEREQFWIRYYKDNGYNLTNSTNGGNGSPGRKFDKKTIKKLSEKRKEYYRNNPDKKALGLKQAGFLDKKPKTVIDNIIHKHCSDCDLYKPITNYHKNKCHSDGYCSICIECAKTRRIKRKFVKTL